ncbi:MAG: TonB family protein, partial [Polyangiaceae bacterium]
MARKRVSQIAGALGLLLGWADIAAAQPQAAAVVPPRVERVTQVPYPPGGEGNASVVLVLTIDKDGSVRSAEVERGDEPFATVAREAASAWRFTPASRDGAPVAARIRYQVEFVEEKVTTPEAPVPSGPTVPGGAAPASPTGATGPGAGGTPSEAPVVTTTQQAIEVEVQGIKSPPSVSSLRRAEVRELPGAFGDPFRAIEILPGVTPIVSGLPFFYVRGAPPGNVGYFLDGVRVPYLFHAAAGPSVVHPAVVDRVDLYSGGYPAR